MTERQVVLRYAVAALLLYVAAFAALSVGGARRSTVIVIVAGVLLVIAALLLQITLSRARKRELLSPRIRLLAPVGIMAAGVALMAYWWLGTSLGNPTGGWGLCGLCAFYLGAGQALTELRSREGGAPWRGLIVTGACAALFAVGLVLCLEASAGWLALAGLALLVGPVGLSLLSEDVLRLRPPAVWLGALLGLVLVVAGALWLRDVTGSSTTFTLILAGALLVLVGAIASNTQADVLLVVTVIALIWLATPRGVAPGDTIEPAVRQPALVALGDSYMSGEGAQKFFEGTNDSGQNECRRSPTAYAHRVVEPGGASAFQHLAFFACSGAVAADLHDRAQWKGEPIDDTPDSGVPQLEQLRELQDRSQVDIRLVIVSIGGNDAGFAKIGMACLAPGSCVERGPTWLTRLEQVGRRVDRAYSEIRAVVGTEVPVLAVPYPQPISDRPCDYSLLARDEHHFLHAFVQQLNGVISRSARAAGFYFLDTMGPAFTDRLRICDAPADEIGVNFIALDSVNGVVDQAITPTNWIHNSLHPNEDGHVAMADVLERWLRSHPDPAGRPAPEDEPPPFEPASLEELMRPAEVSYCGGPDPTPDYCDRSDDDWTVTQVGLVVRDASIPALLIVAGWWLLWLPLLALTRPWWERLGKRAASSILR
jgi:lysophospholipase L1-like esterase